jgi:predicted PurR-regulated permease PerM
MDRGVFFALFYFAAVVLVVTLILLLLWPFLSAVAWAGILAVAAQPVYRKFLSWCRGRKAVASLLATLFLLLAVAGPVMTLLLVFANEAAQILSAAEQAVAEGRMPGARQLLEAPIVSSVVGGLEPFFSLVDLRSSALATLKEAATGAVSLSRSLAVNVLGAVFKSFVMVLLLFFAFRDGEAIAEQCWGVLAIKARDKDLIAGTVRRVVYAVLYGVLLTCVVQGSLVGVGFALMGLPSPVFFGALGIGAAFVPVLGTALVWAPGVIYLFATSAYGRAVFLLLWGVLVVSSIDNFLRPLFISGRAKIPFVLIALGVLGGLFSVGFVGVILGPLLLAVSIELFRIYREGVQPGGLGLEGPEDPDGDWEA